MHTVNSVLFGAGFMLLDMGYQPEPGREDEVLSLAPAAEGQHPVNMHVVTRVARDCLLAGMECRLLADVHAAVTSKVPISMEEVIEFRRDHIGSVEVCSRELLYRKQQLSPEVRDLIHQLLQKNPADRIKLDKIVEHPWLRLQECPPSATAQDSGMFPMTTTISSSNSNISRPVPRPLEKFPMLTEYSEESPGSHQVAGLTARQPLTPQLAPLPSVANQAGSRDMVREESIGSASGLTRQVSTLDKELAATDSADCETGQSANFYQCNICQKKIKQKRNFRAHVKKHLEGLSFVCNCGRKFQHKFHLTFHSKKCTADSPIPTKRKEKRLSCIYCDKEFKRNYLLTRHIESVHFSFLNNNYNCELCGLQFSRLDALKRHKNLYCKLKE